MAENYGIPISVTAEVEQLAQLKSLLEQVQNLTKNGLGGANTNITAQAKPMTQYQEEMVKFKQQELELTSKIKQVQLETNQQNKIAATNKAESSQIWLDYAEQITKARLEAQTLNTEEKLGIATSQARNTLLLRQTQLTRLGVQDEQLMNDLKAKGNALTGQGTLQQQQTAIAQAKVLSAKAAEVVQQERLNQAQQTGRNLIQQTMTQMMALQMGAKAVSDLGAAFSKPFDSAYNSTIEYQDSLAKVRRTFSDTITDVGQFDTSIMSQMKNITQSFATSMQEISDIAAIGGQLGVASDEVGDFTQAVAMAADTSGESAELVAEGIARIVNLSSRFKDIDISNVDNAYEKVANTVTQLDLMAVATTQDILKTGTELAPIAKAYGYSADEALGYATALASAGVQAENSRGSFIRFNKGMSDALTKGGDEMRAFEQIIGKSSEEINRDFGSNSNQVFMDFIKGLSDMQEAGKDFNAELTATGINTQRNGYAYLALAANYDLLVKSVDKAKASITNYDQLLEQTTQRNATIAKQLQILDNNWQSLGQSAINGFGNKAVAALTAVNGAMRNLNITAEQGTFMPILLGIGAASSAGVGGILKLGGSVGNLIAQFVQMQFYMTQLAGQKAFTSLGDSLLHPIITTKALMAAQREQTVTGGMATATAKTEATVMNGLAAAEGAATVATKGLSASMKALLVGTGVGLLLVAVGAGIEYVMNAMDKGKKTTAEYTQEQEKLKQTQDKFGDALDNDGKTFKETGQHIATLSAGVEKLTGEMDENGDVAEIAAKKVAHYGEAAKQAIIDVATENGVDFASLYENAEVLSLVGLKYEELAKALDEPTKFDEYANKVKANIEKMKAAYSELVETQKIINIIQNGPSGAYVEGLNIDISNLNIRQLDELTGKIKKLYEEGKITEGQFNKSAEAIETFKNSGAGLDQKLSDIEAAAGTGGQAVDELRKDFENMRIAAEKAKIVDILEAGGEAAYATKQAFNELADSAKQYSDSTDSKNKIQDDLEKIADNAYKARNGLTNLADERGNVSLLADYVENLFKTFDNDPADVMIGLVNALDTMSASGITAGEAFDYTFQQLLQVAQLLNNTYGLNIDTSKSFQNVNELRNEIVRAINDALSANNTLASLFENSEQYSSAIKMIKVKNSIRNSEIQADIRATNATNANTKATGSNSAAKKDNAKATEEEIRTITDYISDLEKLINAYNKFKYGVMEAWQSVQNVYDTARENMKDTVKEIENQIDDMIKKLYGRQSAKDSINERLIDLREKIEQARLKWKELQAELNQQRADESQLRYWLSVARAVGDVAEEQRILAELEKNQNSQSKTKADMNSTAGEMNMSLVGDEKPNITNRKDVIDLAKAYAEYVAMLAETGASEADVAKAQADAKTEFMATAEALGFNNLELQLYAKLFDEALISEKAGTKTAADRNKAMLDAVKAEQAYITALINSGASQDEVNSAMAQGVTRIRQLGNELGISGSDLDYFTSGLTDLNSLIASVPPINFTIALDPVQRAIDDFFAHIKKGAADAGSSAGGSLGGGIGGGAASGFGNAQQSALEYYTKLHELETKALNEFLASNWERVSTDQTTKAALLQSLLEISTSETLTTDEIKQAWQTAFQNVQQNDDVTRQQLVASAIAVATEQGIQSNAGRAAYEASFIAIKDSGNYQMKDQLIAQAEQIAIKEGQTSAQIEAWYRDMARKVGDSGDIDMRDRLNRAADSVRDKANEDARKAKDNWINAFKSITPSDFKAVGQVIGRGLVDGMKGVLEGIAGGIGDKISGAFSGFASGTNWTGGLGVNQIAGVVHGQEAVIQAPYAARFQKEITMMRNGQSPMQTQYVVNNSGITASQMEDITNGVIRAIYANKNVVISAQAISTSQQQLATQNASNYNV